MQIKYKGKTYVTKKIKAMGSGNNMMPFLITFSEANRERNYGCIVTVNNKIPLSEREKYFKKEMRNVINSNK